MFFLNRVNSTTSTGAHVASAVCPSVAAIIQPWAGPYGGVPPFDQASPATYKSALEAGIAALRADIAAIGKNAATPSFDNTIKALEQSGMALDRATAMFAVAKSNVSTPELQTVDAEMSPDLAAARDEVVLNNALFERVEAVWRGRATANLTPEQRRLVELIYDKFVRAGARLNPTAKTCLSAINQELASLFSTFQRKVLADESTYVTITARSDLAGLPANLIAALKAAADEKGLDGRWIVPNMRSAVEPLLTFADNRSLRERVWRAFVQRGDNGDANDTKSTIVDIVRLRAERARLLGYPSHAHWRMSDTMANDPARAEELLARVWKPAVERVGQEVAEMQELVNALRGNFTIQPWDYRYYAEKVRKAKYDLDEGEIKPYFELNNMMQAAFYTADQLFGLTFTEVHGVPVFHPDVRVYEVKDKDAGRLVGVYYSDNFARTGKRSGAWMTSYRDQSRINGHIIPLVSNNNNFIKSAPGEPILISLSDAETLFHEFGHALHGLLSNVTYPSVSGTNTPRDFVEYPSQVMEHWILTREILDKFARHYQTGQPMPAALVEKVRRASTFNQGFKTVEDVSSAIIDMNLHKRPSGISDAAAFEREELARIGMPKEIVMRHRLPHFLHLFADDRYSAGYYSYLWSEVMDADTWEAFVEAGPFNAAMAKRWRQTIFSVGNSVDLLQAYRDFRGRDPDVAALLALRGFPSGRPSGPRDSR